MSHFFPILIHWKKDYNVFIVLHPYPWRDIPWGDSDNQTALLFWGVPHSHLRREYTVLPWRSNLSDLKNIEVNYIDWLCTNNSANFISWRWQCIGFVAYDNDCYMLWAVDTLHSDSLCFAFKTIAVQGWKPCIQVTNTLGWKVHRIVYLWRTLEEMDNRLYDA